MLFLLDDVDGRSEPDAVALDAVLNLQGDVELVL